VLSRFNTIFDYHNERLAFSPNRNYTRPLTADKSGLQLRPHVQGAMVRHIAEDSKAANSSLQVGDIITSFNGTPVSAQTIGELKRSLSSGADSVELCWQSKQAIECSALPLASRFRHHGTGDRG
jgi:C-terminal processing protease CtpA/Prc